MKHLKYTFSFLLGIFLAATSSAQTQDSITNKDTNGVVIIEDERIEELVATYSETQPNGVPGYRVQVFFTAKKAIALEKKASFAEKFPDITVKADYSGAPYFKVLAGAFRTKLQAEKLLKLVKEDEEFSGSFIVTSNISIDEFKVDED